MGGCSNEEEVSTERLEYRKDEKGIVRLYYAGEDEPVGKWKFARVIENHSNGEKNSRLESSMDYGTDPSFFGNQTA